MISREFAERFSKHWIDSWNSHDLEAVLSHYSDDFEMSSPYIIGIAGESSGNFKGKAEVGAYWSAALKTMPDLHFELVKTLVGVKASRFTIAARAEWPRKCSNSTPTEYLLGRLRITREDS